ncbi:MAG TPA: chorismate mutase [Dehalococcoidia bacterium]|nr:chorismate mutase [Dehalococcoidia bacterium]
MRCRGIRGATTVDSNSREAILAATSELLDRLVDANGVETDDIASALFTTTPDLTAEFPAVAARERGWSDIALMCGHEMNVPGSLRMCLRVLLHVNTEREASELVHIYLRGATVLRPDKQHADGRQENSP